MLGYPKFNYHEEVEFKINDEKLVGVIEIIDSYGTFFQQEEVSYDIYVKSNNTLYKHIKESKVEKHNG